MIFNLGVDHISLSGWRSSFTVSCAESLWVISSGRLSVWEGCFVLTFTQWHFCWVKIQAEKYFVLASCSCCSPIFLFIQLVMSNELPPWCWFLCKEHNSPFWLWVYPHCWFAAISHNLCCVLSPVPCAWASMSFLDTLVHRFHQFENLLALFPSDTFAITTCPHLSYSVIHL